MVFLPETDKGPAGRFSIVCEIGTEALYRRVDRMASGQTWRTLPAGTALPTGQTANRN